MSLRGKHSDTLSVFTAVLGVRAAVNSRGDDASFRQGFTPGYPARSPSGKCKSVPYEFVAESSAMNDNPIKSISP